MSFPRPLGSCGSSTPDYADEVAASRAWARWRRFPFEGLSERRSRETR